MTPPEGSREQLVSRAFVALADTLVDDYDVIELLTRLVGYSVQLLDADAAGIMLADPAGVLRSVAFSNKDARLTELMQLQANQGPCVDCYRTGGPVTVADLAEATSRWPGFATAATAAPVFRAVHALPLRLRGEAIGALNLFRRHTGSLPADDAALGQALADVATIAILQERAIRRAEVLTEQLQVALNSRVIIEQAKGVLAQHSGMPMDQAFDQLRGYTRAHNRRLADVARALAEATLHPNLVITATTPPPAPTT
jgi:transcriptional regulator with GAF, ATPase, and Fis domain